ncbi:MAG: AbrB/MazE/SpoVT family DNA-binding domain-containing protein [Candidatus Woesearchaeota archaeon]
MKIYPKPVSSDSRGQLIIPKEARNELLIEEGTAFWVFYIKDEGILLKKVVEEELNHNDRVIMNLKEKASRINIDTANIDSAITAYKKKGEAPLQEI